MATKKAGKKKTASKKASSKKTSVKSKDGKKRERTRSARKKLPPYEPNQERIERFMRTMIASGYMGKAIADSGKERKRQAGSIRQMAETCDRQFRKFGRGK